MAYQGLLTVLLILALTTELALCRPQLRHNVQQGRSLVEETTGKRVIEAPEATKEAKAEVTTVALSSQSKEATEPVPITTLAVVHVIPRALPRPRISSGGGGVLSDGTRGRRDLSTNDELSEDYHLPLGAPVHIMPRRSEQLL